MQSSTSLFNLNLDPKSLSPPSLTMQPRPFGKRAAVSDLEWSLGLVTLFVLLFLQLYTCNCLSLTVQAVSPTKCPGTPSQAYRGGVNPHWRLAGVLCRRLGESGRYSD